MRRSTAIRNLREMAQVAGEKLELRQTDFGWPLVELWAAGELLDGPPSLDRAAVVLVLDLPAEELPWLAEHPTAHRVAQALRLGKRPIDWWYRPATWPAWNAEHRRVVRFWSDTGGADDEVLDALAQGRAAARIVEPSAAEVLGQLERELAVARRHLDRIVDRYGDHAWRREVSGPPEDHLWRAAAGCRQIEHALDQLT